MQNKLPVGILKVDYTVALMGEKEIKSPIEAVAAVSSQMSGLPKEYGAVLCLDIASRPLCVGMLGSGEAGSFDFNPKEIAQFALLTNAAGVILLHNHPANGKLNHSLRPSPEDIDATRSIGNTLGLFGISLQDHIIVNYMWENGKCSPAFFSMRSKRAYKNLFASHIVPVSSGRCDRIFGGADVFDRKECGNDMHEEKTEELT